MPEPNCLGDRGGVKSIGGQGCSVPAHVAQTGALLDRAGLGVLIVFSGLSLASLAALLALRTSRASTHPETGIS